MTASREQKIATLPVPSRNGERLPLHQYFVPNYKAKTKSRASSHAMEFLSRVFTSEGASRFFKTFLLRFLFDANGQSSDDGYATLSMACAL